MCKLHLYFLSLLVLSADTVSLIGILQEGESDPGWRKPANLYLGAGWVCVLLELLLLTDGPHFLFGIWPVSESGAALVCCLWVCSEQVSTRFCLSSLECIGQQGWDPAPCLNLESSCQLLPNGGPQGPGCRKSSACTNLRIGSRLWSGTLPSSSRSLG